MYTYTCTKHESKSFSFSSAGNLFEVTTESVHNCKTGGCINIPTNIDVFHQLL